MGHRALAGITVLTALALLPSVGDAVFKGSLVAESDASLEITPSTGVTDSKAVTITYLNRKGNTVRDIDIATLAPGAGVAMVMKLPKNTGRVYIDLDQSPASISQIRVTQGPSVITLDVTGDGRMVLDVVPAP